MGWYVLYCKAGQEEILIRSCRQHLSDRALEEAFQFSYERMKKYLGAWHVDTYRMFPNYVFLQSSAPKQLSKELEQYRNITDILEGDGLLLPVKQEEEEMIRALCGEHHHMSLSRGIVRDGAIRVIEGPLVGRESLIRRIDLHRRIAVLNLKLNAEGKDIWAGIDIVQKS